MSRRRNGVLIAEAEAVASRLLAERGVTKVPVCPFEIAKDYLIAVAPKETNRPGVSGILMRCKNSFAIIHASHIKNDGFIRFTVAHELGHYFIPGHPEQAFPEGDGFHYSKSGFVSNDTIEIQADHFAKELLMPETLFRRDINDFGQGFPAIKALASRYNTSITATAIRYCTLTDDPVIVIMSCGNMIDWAFMSSPFYELPDIQYIRKGESLPPDSYTFGFNRDTAKVENSDEDEGWTRLSDWIEEAPGIEMKEDIVGLGSYGKTLTVLFADVIDYEIDD
jgi:Zn-dependent peptidase ImmA (M78 family)